MSQTNMFFNQFYKSFQSVSELITASPIEDAKFGILNLNVISCNITSQWQEFVFVIDRSGSMSDRCSDGRTKMQHIIHTLKNMILYFHENSINNLNITVFAFDDNYINVLKRTQINSSNLQEILTKIDGIHPSGSTNIEIALKKTGDYINQLKTDYPQHNISHIFMTDGDATIGNKDPDILKSLVDDDIENAFIGFGLNHDSELLTHISSNKNSAYHFIDALEKSGLVYGEILHGILYKYLTNVEINVENGLIYDFKTNQWKHQLFIGTIAGEANKTYHLISNSPDSCKIILTCTNLEEEYLFEASELIATETDHTRYLYRQRTLELLFEVSELHKNKIEVQKLRTYRRSIDSDIKPRENISEYSLKIKLIKEEECKLREKLHLLFDEIKKYMEDNNLKEDSFFKNLCDDIYISYRTLGTQYGAMYNSARQTSQGTQRCYTVSHTPDEEDYGFVPTVYTNPTTILRIRPPGVSRQTSGFHTLDLFDDDNTKMNLLQHNLSDFDEAPYLTPTATKLMRDVSSSKGYPIYPLDYDDEEDEDENDGTQPI